MELLSEQRSVSAVMSDSEIETRILVEIPG